MAATTNQLQGQRPKVKAALRGVSHNYAAIAAAAAGTLLTLDAPTPRAQFGCFVYTLSLTLMFTISATYHIPTWGVVGRNRMRKLDHAGIYGIIAGKWEKNTIGPSISNH